MTVIADLVGCDQGKKPDVGADIEINVPWPEKGIVKHPFPYFEVFRVNPIRDFAVQEKAHAYARLQADVLGLDAAASAISSGRRRMSPAM